MDNVCASLCPLRASISLIQAIMELPQKAGVVEHSLDAFRYQLLVRSTEYELEVCLSSRGLVPLWVLEPNVTGPAFDLSSWSISQFYLGERWYSSSVELVLCNISQVDSSHHMIRYHEVELQRTTHPEPESPEHHNSRSSPTTRHSSSSPIVTC